MKNIRAANEFPVVDFISRVVCAVYYRAKIW